MSKTDGQLLTFSFQIEAYDERKCYLLYDGQVSRFYGQDVFEILPKLFDDNEDNSKFIKSEIATEIAKNIKISDVHFETFYASFGNDRSFPKYK